MCSGLTENCVSDTKTQYVNYLYHYPHPAQRTMELLSVGLAAPLVRRVNRAFSQSQNQVFPINFHKKDILNIRMKGYCKTNNDNF